MRLDPVACSCWITLARVDTLGVELDCVFGVFLALCGVEFFLAEDDLGVKAEFSLLVLLLEDGVFGVLCEVCIRRVMDI